MAAVIAVMAAATANTEAAAPPDENWIKGERACFREGAEASGKTVYVESLSHDLYAAIDSLIDKLDRQVMKYKSQVQEHNHQAIKHMPEEEIPAAA